MLIDLPPVLPVTDALVVAALTGNVLLVIEPRANTRLVLSSARQQIDRVGSADHRGCPQRTGSPAGPGLLLVLGRVLHPWDGLSSARCRAGFPGVSCATEVPDGTPWASLSVWYRSFCWCTVSASSLCSRPVVLASSWRSRSSSCPSRLP